VSEKLRLGGFSSEKLGVVGFYVLIFEGSVNFEGGNGLKGPKGTLRELTEGICWDSLAGRFGLLRN
jgi:hypothetical protein